MQTPSRRAKKAATNANIKTKKMSSVRRSNATVQPAARCDVSNLERLPDWCLPSGRRSLSPTRKLALEQLQAENTLQSRSLKSLVSGGGSFTETGRELEVVFATRSVLDIQRLRRRADRRRDEVALHLVSHDPNSAVFRAALSPMVQSYQLAPRLPSL